MAKIKLEDIRIDGGTQPRKDINEDIVSEYAEAMQDGDKFPPVVVFQDGANYWLADGFHRYHASKKVGYLEIEAETESGTKQDAILYSVGANSDHGLRRSNEDKRKAVETLLNDDKWSEWNNRKIARKCAVSHTMVNKMRGSLETVSSAKRKYTDKHGNESVMDTSNIGNRSEKSNGSGLDNPKDFEPERGGGYDISDNVDPETGEVLESKPHHNTKVPEEHKENCPYCGQKLPDHLQIHPDRRRPDNDNINIIK